MVALLGLRRKTNRYIDMVERLSGQSHVIVIRVLGQVTIDYVHWQINSVTFANANQFVVAMVIMVQKNIKDRHWQPTTAVLEEIRAGLTR